MEKMSCLMVVRVGCKDYSEKMNQQLNYLKCLVILRRRKEKRRKIKELESAKNEANKQGKKVIQKR